VAIDKSRTSPWMKAVLIIIIVAFVASLVAFVPASLTGNNTTTPTTGTGQGSAVDQAAQRYAPAAQALESQLASDPESYTAMVNLGNLYVDWGGELQQASQTSSAAALAAVPIWRAAKNLYGDALAIKQGEAPVEGNYALMLYYTGETDEAIKWGLLAVKSDPKLVPAWLNLGNFYSAKGDAANAKKAWAEVVKIAGATSDQGKQAQQLIDGLGTTAATTTP